MNEITFNLLKEPWILVMDMEGETKELSMTAVFEQAHELSALSGEIPTQDVAILRLLLAVLYAVFFRVDTEGNEVPLESAEDAWARYLSLWNLRKFPIEEIRDYLYSYEERFDLFHPERPFFQIASGIAENKVRPNTKKIKTMISDIAESENKPNLFINRTDNKSCSFPETARWLVHMNSFDTAPGGSPGKDKTAIKGYGLTWLNELGVVWLSGSTLFETLMLNLVFLHNQDIWEEGQPHWENDRAWTVEDLRNINPPFPQNPAELLAMQFRYVTLLPDEDKKGVSKYKLWSGVKLDGENAFTEKMTLWKKDKSGSRTPKKHGHEKFMWRDYSSFLCHDDKESERPGVVAWAETLTNRFPSLLGHSFIKLNIAGIEYKQNTSVSDLFSDSLKINAGLLSKLGDVWNKHIAFLLQKTEECVQALGWLAHDLARAAGDNNSMYSKRKAAMEDAYFRLDNPFRNWLAEIDPSVSDMTEAEKKWIDTMIRIINQISESLAAAAGEKAFVGVTVRDIQKNERQVNTATSYLKYKAGINKALKGR